MARRQVNKGNPAAMLQLGFYYARGSYGLAPSRTKAAQLYRRAADLGYVQAMYKLGMVYETGIGVKLDMKEAVKYYRMAANRGCADAQLSYGRLFHEGSSVTQQDYAEGARLYKLAADQGLTSAEFNLGLGYVNGQGVAEDYAEASRWFERAAAKGDAQAAVALEKVGNLRAYCEALRANDAEMNAEMSRLLAMVGFGFEG